MVQGDPLQGNSTSISVDTSSVAFTWSALGDDLAFVSSGSGACELEVTNVSSGSATTPVSAVTGLSCASPVDLAAWSPDNSSIAFTHGQSIFVVPANSAGLDVTALTPIVSLASPILEIGWTPDSAWVLFTESPSANAVELALVPPSGDGGATFPLFPDGGPVNVGLDGFAIFNH
jgi:Tol biopolymer transport system component